MEGIDHVSWMSRADRNLFLMGETHKEHTRKHCDSILDVLKLIERSTELPDSGIDLMIEMIPNDHTMKYAKDKLQIGNVREHFYKCVVQRNCPVRVHWTDPSDFNGNTHTIHKWLFKLARTPLFEENWTKDEEITEFFNQESDMPKLLTENRLVMKEIQKASLIEPRLTVKFATKLFMEMYEEDKKRFRKSWQELAKWQMRHVMDFYTVARMIKLKMKNIIFYAGRVHTEAVIKILSRLNYTLNRTIKGTCA